MRAKTSRLLTAAALVAALLPLCIGAFFWWFYGHRPKKFELLCAEDALVENLQFVGFLAAGLLGVWLALKFWRGNDKLNALAYGLFGLLCIFIAMEEISWGQRIIGFDTPDALKDENIQEEFNLHNLGPVQKMLFLFYAMVGGYALLSAGLWAVPALRKQRWFRLLSVCPCLLLYFLPVLIYGVYRLRLGSWREMRLQFSYKQARMISLIQEPVELGLAAGFLLIGIAAWLRLRQDEQPKTGKADVLENDTPENEQP